MRKGTLYLLTASLSMALLSTQALHAQTNTALGDSALLSNTSGSNNTAIGFRALRYNTTGFGNTAVGSRGLLFNTQGFNNTALGWEALSANTTGNFNTAHGTEALRSNTTGFNNTAVGAWVLRLNTTGIQNTAMGYFALVSNSTGSWNTATGGFALASNTTGSHNTAYGFSALYGNNMGSNNTASGDSALFVNTTGNSNTALGSSALLNNNTGSFNTASGNGALRLNTFGNYNTASGNGALRSNTTGNYNTASGSGALFSNTGGSFNTASGYEALYSNTTGLENVATGYHALRYLNKGFFNTASGDYALYLASETYNNTASGALALALLTTGHHNTALGKGAGYTFNPNNSTFVGALSDATTSVTNSTALGYGAMVTADNQVRIGNSAVTSIGGEVNWTAFSDGRYKKNLKADVPGLEFITKLRPVTYTLDVSGIDSKLTAKQPAAGAGVKLADETAKLLAAVQPSTEEQIAKAEKAKVVYTGFVAQEVEEAAKALNYDFSGVDKPKNKEDFYGLRYGDFVVPLVKAVQELSVENKELKEDNKQQQQQIEELKGLVNKLLNSQPVTTNNTNVNITGAYLEQSTPNPSRGSALIRYHLPQGTASAQVVVTNSKGQVLKTIALNSRGDGQVSLQGSSLPAGTYTYSLWIEGRQADTKQMIIVR